MPSAHPFVEGQGAVGVVYLKILVMQVMCISMCVYGGAVAHLDLVESDVTNHRPCSADLQMIECKKGMRRKDQVDESSGPIQ